MHSSCTSVLGSYIHKPSDPHIVPYIGNHSWKKSFMNYLLCHSLQENFRNLGNLMYKILAEIKSVRKHSQMLQRFAKIVNFSSVDNSHYMVIVWLYQTGQYKIILQVIVLISTVRPLLQDTLNKGHNTFNLSIKDKFCGPYRTMAIQFYLLKKTK